VARTPRPIERVFEPRVEPREHGSTDGHDGHDDRDGRRDR
jgi:hypothetical protein